MSVEIESQSVCDGPECHKRIHEGEACYCHDCWTAKRTVTKEIATLAFRRFWGRINAEEPPPCAWEWFWPMLVELGIIMEE